MYKYQRNILKIFKSNIACSSCLFSHANMKIQNSSNITPIISCKRTELNQYSDRVFSKHENIPLASKGWHHRKSKGDYFIIHPDKRQSSANEIKTSFSQLGLSPEIEDILKSQCIEHPTKIQIDGIPIVLTGKNCLLAAETGCGKTLAYLLPMIHQILEWKNKSVDRGFNSPLGLILLPSRELANQIGKVIEHFAYELGFKSKVIIGGRTKQKMINPSFEMVDVLIATIGAISKLTTTGIYRMSHVHHLVMDEADTLLDDSFNEKLIHFLRKVQLQYAGFSNNTFSGTQLTLVSATIPKSLPDILGNVIPPESITQVTTNQLHCLLVNVPQRFLRLGKSDKPTQLLKIIKDDVKKRNPVIIFSNRSSTCDWVSMFLNENGIKCTNLNGDMHMEIRKDKFEKFQNGEVNVLSCTDIGSRGLDTIRVKHVLNYDFPLYTADYIHRCGRTGRLGSSDNCRITNFVSGSQEVDLVQKIEFAARKLEPLRNVNGNITQIIRNKIMKDLQKDMVKLM